MIMLQNLIAKTSTASTSINIKEDSFIPQNSLRLKLQKQMHSYLKHLTNSKTKLILNTNQILFNKIIQSGYSLIFIVLLICLDNFASAQITPVIGGKCSLSAQEVQIGGKQTQFFLKCESNSESAPGEGIWVVKSRQTNFTLNQIPAATVVENAETLISTTPSLSSSLLSSSSPQISFIPSLHSHPKKSPQKPILTAEASVAQSLGCEQDSNAQDGVQCTSNENCLQSNFDTYEEYLQCDPISHCWSKKHCQRDYAFSFDHQACILLSKSSSSFHQFPKPGIVPANGLICTYSQCSSISPCTVGNCNNGYCCSPAAAPIPTSAYPACPGNLQPYGICNNGVCAPGYQCVQPSNLCCQISGILSQSSIPASPPILPPPIALAQQPYLPPLSYCPGGVPAAGSCVAGRCSSGYACSPSNACCSQLVPAIPATVCPDGTQAAGACVNNQCGTGFICNQGLCCANSAQTPRCLDGSQAIGACIQGNCGTGYSCTTGNICCPSTINACPNGQTSIGQCINGYCPIGFTCVNNQCCGKSTTPPTSSTITCPREDSRGPCNSDNTCPEPGTECDTVNSWCCPRVQGDPVGPCIQGEGGHRLCPDGFACMGPGLGQCYRLETNTCPPEEQFGPCAPTEPRCPQGFTCIGEFCCSDDGPNILRRAKRNLPTFMQWL